MDLTAALTAAQSLDGPTRQQGTQQLQAAEESNLPVFLVSLVTILADETKPSAARQLAGLLLKNTTTSRDEEKQKKLEQQWLNLDNNTKAAIKQQVVVTLDSSVKEARQTAAQVCARLATIELAQGQWVDLIPSLLHSLGGSDFRRESTLACIGYICEQSDAELLQRHSNEILTAVVQGMRKEEPNNEIKLYATRALFNALEFIRGNMENEAERNYLMSVLCDGTRATDVHIREITMQSLARIAQLYYEKLKPYMQALFSVTFEAVRKDDEVVGLQGIEFWSTICDVELELLESQASHEGYVKGVLTPLVQLLTECLVKQNEDSDEDEWNLAAAAGTCLCLVAQTAQDDIVQHIMPFISQNIANPDWKFREAATLAFGSILDGPSSEILGTLVDQAVPALLNHMSDPVKLVRDTTAWTIGRIADLHPAPIVQKYLPGVLEAVSKALKDEASVAAKACWCIENICKYWHDQDDLPTYPLSSCFQPMIEALFSVIDRPDSTSAKLRSQAYEALTSLLTSAANDCLNLVQSLIPHILVRLEATFATQAETAAMRQERSTVQGLLCGCLQVVSRKLRDGIRPFADDIMKGFLRVFGTQSSTVHEESLMGVGAIADAIGTDFDKYMPHFKGYLYLGLRNYQEHQVCNIAVGVVGDIAGALGKQLVPYCDEIMTILLEDLRTLELNRDVKPTIISCFGDIALHIGGYFEKYIQVVMGVLEQAGQTVVPENDEEMVEYLNTLRENICEAYTGILQGMKAERAEAFLAFAPQVLEFIHRVLRDSSIDEGVFRSTVSVVGDLANVFGQKVIQAMQQELIQQVVLTATRSSDEQTRQTGEWAMQQLNSAR